jgi:hypothetical protein
MPRRLDLIECGQAVVWNEFALPRAIRTTRAALAIPRCAAEASLTLWDIDRGRHALRAGVKDNEFDWGIARPTSMHCPHHFGQHIAGM